MSISHIRLAIILPSGRCQETEFQNFTRMFHPTKWLEPNIIVRCPFSTDPTLSQWIQHGNRGWAILFADML